MRETRVAAVQATPVFLDRDATIAKACALIAEAADEDAELAVFPEAFVPTYPDWVWRRRPWDDGEAKWYRRLFESSIEVPGPEVEALADAARTHRCHVAIGVNERSGGTLYNTLLFFGSDGELLSRHRKLMPTGGERLVWGTGDGSTLTVYDTPIGRLGGLICWENYMPLARAALFAQGIEIYVAPTWDNSDEWVPTLRHIAKEGGCHVIGVTPLLRGSDVPTDIPGRDEIYGGDDDWMSRGNTTIVRAGGSIVAGPLTGEEGIIYATLDLDAVSSNRRMFDAAGHYARPDVLRLVVDRRAKLPVSNAEDGLD
jgi:nitrilase